MASTNAKTENSALTAPKLSPKLAAHAISPCQNVNPADNAHNPRHVMKRYLIFIMSKSEMVNATLMLIRSVSYTLTCEPSWAKARTSGIEQPKKHAVPLSWRKGSTSSRRPRPWQVEPSKTATRAWW